MLITALVATAGVPWARTNLKQAEQLVVEDSSDKNRRDVRIATFGLWFQVALVCLTLTFGIILTLVG